MNMVPVSSSNLASIGYDESSKTLYVSFRNGRMYKYSGVPHHIYSGLMSASSHGQYFDRYIVKGGYAYQRVS
ncbi:TPA: KTSC domain-containing protein [Bacillus cereus]|nr:KTSC domain-containing protein [Bacillus cereus]